MTNSLLLKMAIEIVDFPINSMVIFHSYVKLPEGNTGVVGPKLEQVRHVFWAWLSGDKLAA